MLKLVSNVQMKRKRADVSTSHPYKSNRPTYPPGTGGLCSSIRASQLLVLAAAVAAHPLQGRGNEGQWMGPTAAALDPGGGALYLACERSHQIVVLNLATKSVVPLAKLEESPTGLVVSQRPRRLLVTCSGASNRIVSLEPETGRMLASWPAASGVCSPILSRDGRGLYVCNRYENTVCLMRPQSGRIVARAGVEREPVCASLSSDGRCLAVANLLPTGAASRPVVRAAVPLLDARTLKPLRTLWLPNGSTSVRALTFHPGRSLCAVVHNIAHFQGAATQVEHGWMNVSALTLIWLDGANKTLTVLLDEARKGAANPSSVAWSADGLQLCIAHAGTHELSLIDFAALERRLSGLPAGQVVGDFRALHGVRHRLSLGGNGPRALVVAQGVAYAAEFFSDSVSTIDLEARSVAGVIALTPPGQLDPAREGERLFHDATICHQSWQSCASCHPDGRLDGLNWDLLNDGPGNPKNTKSLVLCSLRARARVAQAATRLAFSPTCNPTTSEPAHPARRLATSSTPRPCWNSGGRPLTFTTARPRGSSMS